MDFRIHNRNFPVNLDQDWRNSGNNMSLQSMFSETNLPRNILLNFPFTRVSDNFRHPWNVRDNRRGRPRRHTGLNEMRNSLRRVRHEMYEAYDEFDDARVDLQENRMRLEDAKNGLQNAIRKLDRLVVNFMSPRMMSNLNIRERNALQRDTGSVRQDIEEAKTRIRDVETDLEDEDRTGVRNRNTGRENSLVAGVKRTRSDNDLNAGSSSSNPCNRNDKCADENNCCSICMENPVNAVLYTCGHLCMCYSCSSKLLRRRGENRRCPMCRAVIRDVIKIYRS